jgi:hypothetical protein
MKMVQNHVNLWFFVLSILNLRYFFFLPESESVRKHNTEVN